MSFDMLCGEHIRKLQPFISHSFGCTMKLTVSVIVSRFNHLKSHVEQNFSRLLVKFSENSNILLLLVLVLHS